MSAAFFNQLADARAARALSAGTQPGQRVHPVVAEAMREVAIDLSAAVPQKLTPEMARDAEMLITMGCGDECPYIPGLRRTDWPLSDPKDKPLEEVRLIRDEIRCHVLRLIETEHVPRTREVSARVP
jgi:protein-tyrosine-phosphatase